MYSAEVLEQTAVTLSDELARVSARVEELEADLVVAIHAARKHREAERAASVSYLRRMADLWDGSAKTPQEILRGCARYIDAGGHHERW